MSPSLKTRTPFRSWVNKMKAAFAKKTYQAIYQLTEKDSPLKEDCGALCQGACCQHYDNYGIYLLPGEECMYEDPASHDFTFHKQDARSPGFPPSWTGEVFFLTCQSPCERSVRPLQCRTYPACPDIRPDGVFQLILETLDTRYTCPLIKNSAYLEKLDSVWLENLYQAWSILLNDPLIYDMVLTDSEARREDYKTIIKAYGP